MGFKYVFIPADANDEIKELEYKEDIKELEKDTFREFVEKYFHSAGQDVDRAILLQQLKEKTGVDLEDHHREGKVDEQTMDRLLSATSVEIFPVLLPTKETEYEGISVYCDDKGVAKNLDENPRASSLIQASGYPGQVFKGDVFIGRVVDDGEDIWKREDFSMKDLSVDAGWVQLTKKQRANKSSSDMASMANKMGVHNAAHINPGMLQDAAPKGETADYSWKQTGDEVEVTLKKDGLQKGDKKFVKVVFNRERLKVEVKGEVIIDSALAGATIPDENTWTLSDGILQVTLAKHTEENWPSLLKE